MSTKLSDGSLTLTFRSGDELLEKALEAGKQVSGSTLAKADVIFANKEIVFDKTRVNNKVMVLALQRHRAMQAQAEREAAEKAAVADTVEENEAQ